MIKHSKKRYSLAAEDAVMHLLSRPGVPFGSSTFRDSLRKQGYPISNSTAGRYFKAFWNTPEIAPFIELKVSGRHRFIRYNGGKIDKFNSIVDSVRREYSKITNAYWIAKKVAARSTRVEEHNHKSAIIEKQSQIEPDRIKELDDTVQKNTKSIKGFVDTQSTALLKLFGIIRHPNIKKAVIEKNGMTFNVTLEISADKE